MTVELDFFRRKKKKKWPKAEQPGHNNSFVPHPIGEIHHKQVLPSPTTTSGSPQANKARARARARAKATTAFEGAQTLQSPQQGLGSQSVGTLSEVLDRNALSSPTCPFMGPRTKIQEWIALGADNVLLQVLRKGINAPLHAVPQPRAARKYHNEESLMTTIGEYLEAGVIRKLTKEEAKRTRFWIPTFGREKKDNHKIRLITDLRQLNNCHQVKKHKAETWQSVLQTLSDTKLRWGVTLDLKSYYHHLGLHPDIQRWMRICIQDTAYQMVAMPFGWALAPWWANKFSKPIRAWLNNLQWEHCWWIDDVLILGNTKEQAEERATSLVKKLTELGITVNKAKSMKEATQQFTYVGHHFDLQKDIVSPTQEKQKITQQKCTHQIKGNNFQPRHLASLAGNLVDANKSNMTLHGLPQQIMKWAAWGVNQNAKWFSRWNKEQCWGTTVQKTMQLQKLLQKALKAVQHPTPRVLRARSGLDYVITSDASNQGWGAHLQLQGKEIHTCAQTWTPSQARLHITHKEALASALATKTFRKFITPRSKLIIKTDATSTAWTWRKGSKLPGMNQAIAEMVVSTSKDRIHIEAQHIPGDTNKRADWLSRNADPKNFTLQKEVYHKVCQRLHFQPELDLFASRHNRQCKKFCSWRTDLLSKGNAFQVD